MPSVWEDESDMLSYDSFVERIKDSYKKDDWEADQDELAGNKYEDLLAAVDFDGEVVTFYKINKHFISPKYGADIMIYTLATCTRQEYINNPSFLYETSIAKYGKTYKVFDEDSMRDLYNLYFIEHF